MPVPCSVFCLFPFEFLDDVAGRVGRGEKQNTPEVLVCLFLRLLTNGIERPVGISKRLWRLGVALKDFKNGLAVERKADAKLGLVITGRLPCSCRRRPGSDL